MGVLVEYCGLFIRNAAKSLFLGGNERGFSFGVALV